MTTPASYISEDSSPCLCRQAHGHPPHLSWLPEWKYSKEKGFILRCPQCGFRTFPSHNKQAVKYWWESGNRNGDEHVLTAWKNVYARQKKGLE